MEMQGELYHSTVHGVFIGPARSGKNSLMERLLGKMPSSKSPSTGVAEAVVQVQVQKAYTMAANVEGSIWSTIDYDDEAIRLMALHSDQENAPIEVATSAELHADIYAFGSVAATEDDISTKFNIPIPDKVAFKYEDLSVAIPTHTSNKQYLPINYIPPVEILKTAIKSKGLQALRQHFEKTWSLYLSNTGGQMEFQEVLPLLVSGPCMFFYAFRLDRDLNECYEIHYELPDGTKSDSYKSSITTIEGIVQSLTSIASMGIFVYRGSKKRKVQLRPKVLFIGTHRDRLNNDLATDIIANIPYRNILQETCRMTYFNILHILQENYVFLLKYLTKCKRNGHNLARPCMNLTNQHLQDFLQVLWLCKILGLCRILLAWIVQESCKISAGSVFCS